MARRRLKDLHAPGFQGFSVHHDGDGRYVLEAVLANGRVLRREITFDVVLNLQAARAETLELKFDRLLKEV